MDLAIRESTTPEGLRDIHVIAARTMLKIIKGKQDAAVLGEHLSVQGEKLTITLIQPMYHESTRISPRSMANPHGEDALRYKLDLLEDWHASHPGVEPRLLVVDDGCDGNGDQEQPSGVVAQRIIDAWQAEAPRPIATHVIYLADAIEKSTPLLPSGITSTRDSVKGGSVLYGMAYATQAWSTPEGNRHILVDSDADLSVHPAQLPSLIRPIIEKEGTVMTAASRREKDSVRLIGESRDGRGIFFIDVWQQLLPTLAVCITDTNRGFKAVDANFVPTLLEKVTDRKFPYQIEVLLIGTREGTEAVRPVAVSYIDSEALSTQGGEDVVQTYLNQAQGLLAMARRHSEPYNEQLASLIDELAIHPNGEQIWSEAEQRYTNVATFLASLA
ncbi:MAG TPA: hypothetical protein VK674_00055 [Candidatus Limnocylindria bacterium]|nr:hypothetical protein [Candidatus Limnocylindria bacterium]